jgi:hypothetical protein
MPKVRFHPEVEEIQGTLYDVVFKKSPQGKMIVSKKPDMSKVVWSEAQIAERRRMSLASEYAKAALANPLVGAYYRRRAKKLKKRPRDLAISDYYKGKNRLEKNVNWAEK